MDRLDDSLPDLSLVVPCYNEEQLLDNSVRELIEVFEQHHVRIEVVLVDNGSRDRTGACIDELVAAGLSVVKRVVPVNQGYGNGILVGLAACRGRWVGIVHADSQVEAADVYKIYSLAQQAPRACLVKARRRFRLDGLRRKIVSIFYNLIINVLYPGLGSIDVNSSPKLLPRRYLEAMKLVSRDWFVDPEIMIKARYLRLPVIEINVLAQMRRGGKSNVNLNTCWEFVVNLCRWRFGGFEPLKLPEADAVELVASEKTT
ncbi:MAG: glycosyltransferase family 2 protein [Pirellulales bacterium]|nr:glycosyltransferase family 2 protein [Pirellulales bacterium]